MTANINIGHCILRFYTQSTTRGRCEFRYSLKIGNYSIDHSYTDRSDACREIASHILTWYGGTRQEIIAELIERILDNEG